MKEYYYYIDVQNYLAKIEADQARSREKFINPLIDLLNEKAARAMGVPLSFLYGTDPHGRIDRPWVEKKLVDDYEALQRRNDARHETETVSCKTCHHESTAPVLKENVSMQHKADMSAAWSRALREKVRASEAKRKQDSEIRVDPWYEDWE